MLRRAAELPHFSSNAFRLLAVRPLIRLPGDFLLGVLQRHEERFFSFHYLSIVDGLCVAEARETQWYEALRSRCFFFLFTFCLKVMEQQPEPFRKMFLFKGPPLVKFSAILWWEWYWTKHNLNLFSQWRRCTVANCVKSAQLNDEKKKSESFSNSLHSWRGSPRAKRPRPRFLVSRLMSHFFSSPAPSVMNTSSSLCQNVWSCCCPQDHPLMCPTKMDSHLYTWQPPTATAGESPTRIWHAGKKKCRERKPWLTNQNAVLMPRVRVHVWAAFCYLSHNWQDMLEVQSSLSVK